METLPDDVVVEILVRVTEVAALFRCTATCRRWRLLIADPSFLRRRWPEGVSLQSSLLGFFALQQPREEPTEGSSTTSMPLFTPVPCSPHRFLAIPDQPRGSQAVVLASHRGLLVVRFVPLDAISMFEKIMILAVCDPIAGTSRPLPPLKCNRSFRIEGCTLLTGADCRPTKRRGASPSVYSSFKVLIISYDGRYNLHVSASNELSWRTSRNWFEPVEYAGRVVPQQINIVVCRGMAHWLFKYSSDFYTLNVCAKTMQMSITKLPLTRNPLGFKFSSALLNVTNDGRLSLLGLYRDCSWLEMWTHEGDNKSVDGMADCWHHTKMIELIQPKQSTVGLVQCVCVSEMSGKLLVKDNQDCVYIADLQTGAMETVTDWFCGIVTVAVPFEMDWPTFFMSRLAGGRIKRNKLRGAISKIASTFCKPIVVAIIFGLIVMSLDYDELQES
ncbi:hypothetical protein CFC21_013340 [Triticum aestivum]|uniref:F-box domain-containing protein n=4 Tax=Triticinae TaxID=1648030 RepID=A0A452ZNQ2_AEGTS|nr:uncharacterized protein LOC109744023 [Aegilops tauschii subsp. strangulata]XP_044451383.1 uncharacterized protein LOC123182783 [Triticum aestivum]KAF6997086.1 hypothetical protein CFC21_013340 [Triticum aestivum]